MRSIRTRRYLASCQSLEARRLLANAIVIDLEAVFTPGAVLQVGSEPLLRARLQNAVDEMNRVMSNSRIGVSVRLVHADPIAYVGANDLFVDRTRLANGTNGLAAAQALRDTYGADLLTLIVEDNAGSGGNASLMTSLHDPTNAATKAFSAITPDTLISYNNTLAHELGHNLGAGHERGNMIDPAVGPFPYSYGYRFTAQGKLRHDIMSYDPGAEVPYYANPAVSFRGAPTGSPVGAADQADLATTFAQTAPIVAAYRSTVVADTAPPTAAIDSIRVRGGFAYVTIRYADNTGIDLATIDSSDLTLTLPGFAAPITPVLDSFENPGVGGAFNRVTYRAYLQDVPTAAGDITVGMKPNAVRDEAGLAVPAAASLATTAAYAAGFSYDLSRDLGTLAGGESMLVGDSLADQSTDDVFQFSLTSTQTVSARLAGLVQDGNVFIANDANGDGVYQSSEILAGSFRTGTQEDSFALTLAPGTYYAWVYGSVVTPYTLSLSDYTDTTPPTATLDATDITAPATQFVFNVALDDNVEIDADTARFYSPVRLTNPFGGFYVYFADAIDISANGPHHVATYHIDVGHTLSASDNGVYTVSMEPANSSIFNPALDKYVHDGAGNTVASGAAIGTFKVAIGQSDTTPPTVARVDAPQVYRGGATSYDFDVTYADNTGSTDAALLASQVTVTGPDQIVRVATATGVSPAPAVGSRRTVHYHLAALPGGSWDYTDFGSYKLAIAAGTVKDAANNAIAPADIGTFNVSVPLPGDADGDGVVEFDDLVIVAQNYNSTGKTFAQGNFDDDPAGNVDFNDLVILAQRYNTTRPALPPAIIAGPQKKKAKRAAGDIL